jgi:hypothetical protein
MLDFVLSSGALAKLDISKGFAMLKQSKNLGSRS